MGDLFNSLLVISGIAQIFIFKNSWQSLTKQQKLIISLVGIFALLVLMVSLPELFEGFKQGIGRK